MNPRSNSDQYTLAARELAAKFAPRAAKWDRSREYCWENIADLVDAGLMGMTIPKEFGGRSASYHDTVLVIEEIARACALSARIVVEANMGGISAIMAYGTPEQKHFCAPYVLAGDKPAICISEPEAGSAATSLKTVARKTGSKYVINGIKHWITGGGLSKLHLIFAKIIDEKNDELGIGGFIVCRDTTNGINLDGFTVARREHTLGLCGMPEAELHFENLEVDEKFLLPTPSGPCHGFADLMNAYNSQRVGAGTVAMGIAAGALDHAKRYLVDRCQFGRPLAEFQGLQWMIAEMDASVHASRLMLCEAANSTDPVTGLFPDALFAARAKIFASEAAIKVVSNSLQMFGARGYGNQEPLERMYRDVRMFTIGGGTAQILKTQVGSRLLGIKAPQTRDGYMRQFN